MIPCLKVTFKKHNGIKPPSYLLCHFHFFPQNQLLLLGAGDADFASLTASWGNSGGLVGGPWISPASHDMGINATGINHVALITTPFPVRNKDVS